MRVLVDEDAVVRAAQHQGVAAEQAEALWAELAQQGTRPSRVRDVAWYGGGLVVVIACAFFLGTSWSTGGPEVGLAVALVYAAAATVVAEVLRGRGLALPAALLGLVVVALTPAVTAALVDMGAWVQVDRGDGLVGWLREDDVVGSALALAVGSAVALRHRRPFLLAPVLLALWWLSVQVGQGLGAEVAVGAVLAAGLLASAFALDLRGLPARADWLHAAGLLSLEHWVVDLLALDADGVALFHGLGGLAAVGVAVLTGRRLYLAAGAVGVFAALVHLAFDVFADSLLFPLALAALGIGVVLAGVRLDRVVSRG